MPVRSREFALTAGEEVMSSGPSGNHGGNMDFNEIVEGVTLYFPVFHKGALFYVGDGHAVQGDGEGLGNGVETSLDVQFIVYVHKNKRLDERNPDHYVTARAVESTCWMAGSEWDYPEHFRAGLTPHGVRDKYYFARGPQLVNRVVDIAPYMDKKVWANVANVTQGLAGNNGAALRKRLADKTLKLPVLGEDDETANRQYTKQFALARDRTRGQAHGLEYAEYFHYVAADESEVHDYVSRNAVPL
jgi:hypothetical protein